VADRVGHGQLESTTRVNSKMYRPFVLISGVPASGKTMLGRRLAPALDLPLIDKDDILERLFELRGAGDKERRRMLSRESDIILQRIEVDTLREPELDAVVRDVRGALARCLTASKICKEQI